MENKKIEIRMPITPDQSLFDRPTYVVRGGGHESELRVRKLEMGDVTLGFNIIRYDCDEKKPEEVLGFSFTGDSASKRAYAEAVELGREYSNETGLPLEDSAEKDTLELIEGIESYSGREAADIRGNLLRRKFGLNESGGKVE